MIKLITIALVTSVTKTSITNTIIIEELNSMRMFTDFQAHGISRYSGFNWDHFTNALLPHWFPQKLTTAIRLHVDGKTNYVSLIRKKNKLYHRNTTTWEAPGDILTVR